MNAWPRQLGRPGREDALRVQRALQVIRRRAGAKVDQRHLDRPLRQLLEPRVVEQSAFGHGEVLPERQERQQRLAHHGEPHPLAAGGTEGQRVADPCPEAVQGLGAEGDLVRTGGVAPVDDQRMGAAPHRVEGEHLHGRSVAQQRGAAPEGHTLDEGVRLECSPQVLRQLLVPGLDDRVQVHP